MAAPPFFAPDCRQAASPSSPSILYVAVEATGSAQEGQQGKHNMAVVTDHLHRCYGCPPWLKV